MRQFSVRCKLAARAATSLQLKSLDAVSAGCRCQQDLHDMEQPTRASPVDIRRLHLQTFGAFMGLPLQLRMVKRSGVSEELLGAGVQNLYNS
jgi:hypothetical protein